MSNRTIKLNGKRKQRGDKSRARSALPISRKLNSGTIDECWSKELISRSNSETPSSSFQNNMRTTSPPRPLRRHTFAAEPDEGPNPRLNRRKVNTHNMFSEIFKAELESFRNTKILEIPKMSETMREAMEEDAEDQMPMWMKKAKQRFENGESSESDEDDDERFNQRMGMKKNNDQGYTETTRKLLQRKRDLCKAIQYRKPIIKDGHKSSID